MMKTVPCIPLAVNRITYEKSTGDMFGGGGEVSDLFPTAIALECQIPADMPPLTYDLAVGFREKLTPARQQAGEINLIPAIGRWQGPTGSASVRIGTLPDPFILVEPACIAVPWIHDKTAAADPNATANPARIMHITDLHYNADDPNYWALNELWAADARVLMPDLIIGSGDIVTHPSVMITDYEVAYGHLTQVGIPMVLGIGNHDHYLVGPWRHYFGPVFSTTTFSGFSVINFDGLLPMGSGMLEWIENQVRTVRKADEAAPVFYTCHYPTTPDYFGGGWISIINSLKTNRIAAYLAGHYHTDVVGEFDMLLNSVIEERNLDALEKGLELPGGTTRYLEPITQPILMCTRSTARGGDVVFPERFPNPELTEYSGYRLLTMVKNQVWNYTYDLDGDGIREPQLSTPVGRFQVRYESDVNLGVSPTAGMRWIVNSSFTEVVQAARAEFLLPLPPAGMIWTLDLNSLAQGAFIRASVQNSTHIWYDIRVPLPASPPTGVEYTLRMEPGLSSIRRG
jgi:hypothetical protein